ncbi:MAG: exo-alpha-sialidase [Planctomycetota bacterium]|jgi:hypothetical protein
MNSRPRYLLLSLATACLAGVPAAGAEPQTDGLELLHARKIWDQGPHNAFTDLIRFQDRFFCVFREAKGHVSPDGKIRILSSSDGKQWDSAGLLASVIGTARHDLRDPKICTTPDGRLMICGGAAVRQGSQPATSHRSFVCLSTDGNRWGKIQWVAQPDDWLWRITWHKGKAYGVSYFVSPASRAARRYGTRLYASDDGLKFRPLVPNLYEESGPTEGTLRFATDGTCYLLQRRDGRPSNTALLGTSKPPYTRWTWKDLGRYYGGPNFIQLPRGGRVWHPHIPPTAGRWIAAGRIITPGAGAKTVVCDLDVAEGRLTPLVTLPSGGDTSYPGLLWHAGRLWVSYYSSHEGKTSIYLAVLRAK